MEHPLIARIVSAFPMVDLTLSQDTIIAASKELPCYDEQSIARIFPAVLIDILRSHIGEQLPLDPRHDYIVDFLCPWFENSVLYQMKLKLKQSLTVGQREVVVEWIQSVREWAEFRNRCDLFPEVFDFWSEK